MSDSILSVRNVEKTYRSGSEVLHILRSVSLEVPPGETVAITGASGSGKSTLLNLVGGLDRMDAGEIDSCGYRLDSLGERSLTDYRSQAVGFVFQFHYLLKDFTALENVMLPMVMRDGDRRQAEEKALDYLNRVGIAERRDHYPSQLSGGERQRAALARALINDPSLILADEPTGNLDDDHKNRVADLIFSLVADTGRSLILVTHAGDMASRAHRRLDLRDGILVSG